MQDQRRAKWRAHLKKKCSQQQRSDFLNEVCVPCTLTKAKIDASQNGGYIGRQQRFGPHNRQKNTAWDM